jgi:hypothetical protein
LILYFIFLLFFIIFTFTYMCVQCLCHLLPPLWGMLFLIIFYWFFHHQFGSYSSGCLLSTLYPIWRPTTSGRVFTTTRSRMTPVDRF